MTSEPLPTGADATDAALDQWVADAEAMAAKYQQLSTDVAKVSVAETTPDGLITATVDASGLLTDLRIADRATAMPGAKLAGAVLWAMRRAQSRIAGQVGELMKTTVGDDTAMAEAVMDRYQSAFPEMPEPTRAAAVEEVSIGGGDAGEEPPRAAPQQQVRQPVSQQPQSVQPSAPAAAPARARGPVRRSAQRDEWDGDGESFLEEVDR